MLSKRAIILCKIILQLMNITKKMYAIIGGLRSGGLMSGGLKFAHRKWRHLRGEVIIIVLCGAPCKVSDYNLNYL